jgi:hypothetical protein
MTSDEGYPVVAAMEPGTTASSRTSSKPILLSSAALATLLGAAAVGTGGIVGPDAMVTNAYTGSVVCVSASRITRDELEVFLTTKEKIAGIRHYLSLNMTELAAVLNVGRPTVYAWASVSAAPSPKHRDRIGAIYELARYWRSLSSVPMELLARESMPGGKTMIDLLSVENVDIETVRKAMLQIKEKQDQVEKPASVTTLAAKAGVKLASRPRSNWKSAGELEL